MKQVRFLLLVISLLSVNCGGQTPAAPADTLAQSTVDASGADVTQTDTASPTSDATVIKDTGPAPSPFDGVGAVIEARMKSANIPGLAAAVTARGKVVWSGAYGRAHIAPDRPVTVKTPFMMASVSKTVTAVALMRAVQDGQLSLEDSVNAKLPFSVDNPRTEGEVILIRHLVSHTSGLRDNWSNMPYFDGDPTVSLADYLKGYLVKGGKYYDAKANFSATSPGAAFDYCNIATALAGYVVELVTKTPFDDYCDTHIFDVLGMTNTGWHLADHTPDDVAMPYSWSNNRFKAEGHYGYADYPDGQLRSSISDMARFLAAISNQGELDGSKVLSPATVKTLLSPQAAGVEDSQYVFWHQSKVGSRSVIGHGGADIGVTTQIAFSPKSGYGVILLMNVSGDKGVYAAVGELQELLFDRADLL